MLTRPRIGLAIINTETNAFAPGTTPLAAFRGPDDGPLVTGDAVLDASCGTTFELAGMRTVAEERGWAARGIVSAVAEAGGPVADEAFAALATTLARELKAAGPLDGLLLALHGSLGAVSLPVGDERLLRVARAAIGDHVPLALVLDHHGNVTEAFATLADVVVAYETNPHVDAAGRAVEAGRMLDDLVRGRLPATSLAVAKPPLLLPTLRMLTAEEPMRDVLDAARAVERRHPRVIKVAVLGGYPLADSPAAGPAVVVTATDGAAAREAAGAVAAELWARRTAFLTTPTAPEAAIAKARATPGPGPAILADVADNPGGGGTGDTTTLLHAVRAAGVSAVAACVCDEVAVAAATTAGVGAKLDLAVGGRADPRRFGAPLRGSARVLALADGDFVAQGPMMDGTPVSAGPMALVAMDELRIVLTSSRRAANDRGYLETLGVDCAAEDLLVLKSRGHFRAAFAPIARTVIEVSTPGATAQELDVLDFRRIRRPVWPLDPVARP
jgi:microcystin degradation protein MlrC